MVLILYGGEDTTGTKRAALVLHEKQVPFKFVQIDWRKKEHKSAAYLKLQPFGQVPVLDDDGFILYEGRAIARYIEEKYADRGTQGLIPKNPKAKALFEQAASIEAFNFDPYPTNAIIEMILKPGVDGSGGDKAIYDANMALLEPKLDVYDQILAKQKYLAGDQLTLADLFHLPFATWITESGSDVIQKRPNVARWFKELYKRPSWQAVKDVVGGTLE
ncbi:hypothetical protein NMY22_g3819 [Coprinellus aureogranulatus]|nr:hypothetical protein NMY22_g3819 [Coprinellus aureogranulatus]